MTTKIEELIAAKKTGEFVKIVRERCCRYLRLGFVASELSKELILDDRLWEMAKDLPIDPDNSVDRINRAEGSIEERRELVIKELLKKPFG